MKRLWMISYDIEDDRVRRRVYGVLKNHGERAQYSVFECRLDANELARLRDRLRDEIEDGDSVRWYPLCHWCASSIEWHGQGEAAADDDFYLL